jgi:hypothetical protein
LIVAISSVPMPRTRISVGWFITWSRPFISLLLLLGVRAVKHLVSGADARITDYQVKFDELLTEFHHEAIRNTEITVLRILDVVEGIGGCFERLIHMFL